LWLGRDAFTGEPRPVAARVGEDVGLGELTMEPRRYGFHDYEGAVPDRV
jgi:hypothetical protein